MQMPQIRMESQMARIGIKQTPAFIEQEQPKADLSIEQPKADVSMRTIKGKLTIDQSQAWEEMNLMSTRRLNEIHAGEGMRAISEGTARRAEQGAELINIHNGVNMFAEQAIQNGHPPMKTLSFKYVPSPLAVKIHYERGEIQMDVQENKPVIDVRINKPELTFHRGGVDITMERYAQLKIDYDNLYV